MALATNQRLNTMNTLTAFTLSSLTGGGGRGGGGSSSSRGGSSSSKPRSSVQEQYLQERRRLEDSKWSLKEVLALTLEAERDREDQRLREQEQQQQQLQQRRVIKTGGSTAKEPAASPQPSRELTSWELPRSTRELLPPPCDLAAFRASLPLGALCRLWR